MDLPELLLCACATLLQAWCTVSKPVHRGRGWRGGCCQAAALPTSGGCGCACDRALLSASDRAWMEHKATSNNPAPSPLFPAPQLVPFTCFALESLRPAVRMASAGSAPGTAVPALTRADIAVGDCLEYRVASDRTGQSALYVPAVVVAAGVNIAPHYKKRRPRSIDAVVQRMHERQQAQQGQQAEQQQAQGELDAASAAAAGVPAAELAYQLVWPGVWQRAVQPGVQAWTCCVSWWLAAWSPRLLAALLLCMHLPAAVFHFV